MKGCRYLPPTNVVCEGYVFAGVYLSTGGRGCVPACLATRGCIPACLATRWRCPGPGPGGCPGPCLGVSRPRPRGIQAQAWWGLGPDPGVYFSMHWGRHPHSRQLLLWVVCILLECILVYIDVDVTFTLMCKLDLINDL